MVSLGILPGYSSSEANGVSGDGSVVVGESRLSMHAAEAFRWTADGGMVSLGSLPGQYDATAFDVTPDGSTIVGEYWSLLHISSPHAFRWTAESGMVDLGILPGEHGVSKAYGVSADGSVVMGTAWSYPWPFTPADQAFIWDDANGMRSLKEVLENDFGLDLTGWRLTEATGISDDGLIIVGNGRNPSGEREAWIADLAPGPIPGVASFPFLEDFESGELGSYWTTDSTAAGRILVTTENGPYAGSYHCTMDSAQKKTHSLNELVLNIDLSGHSGVLLGFRHKEFRDNDHMMPDSFEGSHNSDGVAISADGNARYKVRGLIKQDGISSKWKYFEVDLDAAVDAADISYNGTFKIKFQQYDKNPINKDGFAFDEIELD